MALVCSRAKPVMMAMCLPDALSRSASLRSASVRAVCADVRSAKTDSQLSSVWCSCSCSSLARCASALARSSAADAADLAWIHTGVASHYTIDHIIMEVCMSVCTRTCSKNKPASVLSHKGGMGSVHALHLASKAPQA